MKRLLVTALLLGACAQASAPPGAPPVREPPRIVETLPAEGAVIADFAGPVRIRFDKTLSEKGPRPPDMVAVSPQPEGVEVSRHGRELRVDVKGGWKKGVIYHVIVLPGLQDRYGNARNGSYELVFSTGPQITPTALAGVVRDSLTGRPIANARVTAMNLTDSMSYLTLTDTGGFYALRSLPVAAYGVTAFVDVNRDRKMNGVEPRAVKRAVIGTVRDTQVVELATLPYDTTPARLLRAEVRDSQQVRLTFDDFIEPNEPLGAVRVLAWQMPDSTPVAGSLSHVRVFEASRVAQGKTEARPQPVRQGAPAQDSLRVLPVQEIVWAPATPLVPRTRYRITLEGVRNIAGITGGGGSVSFETPARPKLSLPPTDTTKAAKPPKPVTPVKPDSIKHMP